MRNAFVIFFLISMDVVHAQRFFTIPIDSVTRSYMLVATNGLEAKNLPLFIVLHDLELKATSLVALDWQRIDQSALVVFPVGLRNTWGCMDAGDTSISLADEKFLQELIFQVQRDFGTDPSRVFLIGVKDAYCVADSFARRNPRLVRAVVAWNYSNQFSTTQHPASPKPHVDSLMNKHPSSHTASTMTPPAIHEANFEMPFKDFERHVTLELHMGRWQQSKQMRTNYDTMTFIDLYQYHFKFGLQLGYHLNEDLSLFFELDGLIVPKEKKIKSISWGGGQGVQVDAMGKGGAVLPLGFGVNYHIKQGNFRPFVSATVGRTFMLLAGGKASGGFGSIQKEIEKRKDWTSRYCFGTGFDLRISPVTSLRFGVEYALGSKIRPSMGSIERFQGAYLKTGLLFILGEQ